MPENLRFLKARIRTALNISQIAKTLEMVSVAKIRRARVLVETVNPYAVRITALTRTVLAAIPHSKQDHPYLRMVQDPTRILVAIGPEKGLCGPLAANLARRLSELDDPRTLLITVGKRMERAGSRLQKSALIASFPLGTKLPQYSLVYDLVRLIDDLIVSGRATVLEVLFTRFISFFSQVPAVDRILPLALAADSPEDETLVFEPNAGAILASLLPHFLEVRLFDAVIQAYSSEHAARMVAMQNAKDNALDIQDSLTLLYNKTRQERITNEILDLANQGNAR